MFTYLCNVYLYVLYLAIVQQLRGANAAADLMMHCSALPGLF